MDELRRLALFTSGVAELSRDRAERLVRRAVKGGEVRSSQASSVVKNLVETSQRNRRELVELIRSELRGQVEKLGLATTRDLDRLDRRVARLEERAKKTPPKKSTVRKPPAKAESAAPAER